MSGRVSPVVAADVRRVVDVLADMVESTNNAAADDDRGPSNRALCLTLFCDGSGRLGWRGFGDRVEDHREFNDVEELISVLRDEGVEIEAESP